MWNKALFRFDARVFMIPTKWKWLNSAFKCYRISAIKLLSTFQSAIFPSNFPKVKPSHRVLSLKPQGKPIIPFWKYLLQLSKPYRMKRIFENSAFIYYFWNDIDFIENHWKYYLLQSQCRFHLWLKRIGDNEQKS